MPLQIIRQDITKMAVDAIVNTTNEEMVGYSGVDYAVHVGAGKKMDEACALLAPLELGQVKITDGYDLPCKYVIHTVGPVWQGGDEGESEILRSCYLEALKLAVKSGCETVAFPLISSGTYQFPKDKVLKFAIQVITEFLFDNELTVYICVFDKQSYAFSQKLFSDIKEYIDDGYVEESDDEVYEHPVFYLRSIRGQANTLKVCSISPKEKEQSIEEFLREMDMSFQEMLFKFIDEKKMTDVECYKKANVDKRTFSKIKSNAKYRPSKQTAIAFAISLKLDFEDTQALLATVGFTLSKSSVFDKIITYFIINEKYDIFEINEALFEFDQVLLGCFT